jgi:AcrR family transcriptional regulator
LANEELKAKNIDLAVRTSVRLFIENGIQNTTREMIARESGLSRRSTERYFATKKDCVVQSAVWLGKVVHDRFTQSVEALFNDAKHTAKDILEAYLAQWRELLVTEPRIYVFYTEFKSFLYRNSDDREGDYKKFIVATGYRTVFRRIFELGEMDGTLSSVEDPESIAGYITNTLIGCFANAVLVYDTQPEKMYSRVDKYISNTIKLYSKE